MIRSRCLTGSEEHFLLEDIRYFARHKKDSPNLTAMIPEVRKIYEECKKVGYLCISFVRWDDGKPTPENYWTHDPGAYAGEGYYSHDPECTSSSKWDKRAKRWIRK